MKRQYLLAAILPAALLLASPYAVGGTIVLNFDSVSLAPGARTDATAYLAGFGVTFTALAPSLNATPAITNTATGAAVASSSPNDLEIVGPSGPAQVSYELSFATHLTSVAFTRDEIIGPSGDAAWTADAVDGEGNIVATASEGELFGPSAATYTLTGAGIVGLEIFARNDIDQTTFNSPPIDNLTLVSAAPEPGSVALFGSAMIGLAIGRLRCGWRRR